MRVIEPVQIVEVIRIMEQGNSQPLLCKCEHGEDYIVKGVGSTRTSQISEWICANLAQKLDLPIADFALVDVPEVLYDELVNSPLRIIGQGLAFGSKMVQGASWFEALGISHISRELQRKILIFDLWIKNMDRTRANPNLLYRANQEGLVIIDHNLAFDTEFTINGFLSTHVFAESYAELRHDLVHKVEMLSWLETALVSLDEICSTLPVEWSWLNPEHDLPTNYNFDFMRQTLTRCLSEGALWE